MQVFIWVLWLLLPALLGNALENLGTRNGLCNLWMLGTDSVGEWSWDMEFWKADVGISTFGIALLDWIGLDWIL